MKWRDIKFKWIVFTENQKALLLDEIMEKVKKKKEQRDQKQLLVLFVGFILGRSIANYFFSFSPKIK